jgi:hypothetical protein
MENGKRHPWKPAQMIKRTVSNSTAGIGINRWPMQQRHFRICEYLATDLDYPLKHLEGRSSDSGHARTPIEPMEYPGCDFIWVIYFAHA